MSRTIDEERRKRRQKSGTNRGGVNLTTLHHKCREYGCPLEALSFLSSAHRDHYNRLVAQLRVEGVHPREAELRATHKIIDQIEPMWLAVKAQVEAARLETEGGTA